MKFKQMMLPVIALGLMTAPGLAQQPASSATTGNAPAGTTAQLTIDDARRIAGENGMKTFKELKLDDGRWEEAATAPDARWRSKSTPAPARC